MAKRQTEKRAGRRFPLKLPVVVKFLENGPYEVTGHTCDVSAAGAFLYVNSGITGISEGVSIDFVMTLPSEITLANPIRVQCSGKVVRVHQEEDKQGVAVAINQYDFMRLIRDTVELLLQAVIVPGNRTFEGRLVEAVALPWFEIIQLLGNDPALAFQIEPRKWEEIIAGAYKAAGFDEVTLTSRSGDFGRDVIAVKRGIGTIRIIDQVKAYRPGHLVTANDVRALLGVLEADKASKGFLTTTSDFAPKLVNDILLRPFMPARLELVNGKALLARLTELAIKKRVT